MNPAETRRMKIIAAVKDLLDLGYSSVDIMEVLHLSEATYRSYLNTIEEEKAGKFLRNNRFADKTGCIMRTNIRR